MSGFWPDLQVYIELFRACFQCSWDASGAHGMLPMLIECITCSQDASSAHGIGIYWHKLFWYRNTAHDSNSQTWIVGILTVHRLRGSTCPPPPPSTSAVSADTIPTSELDTERPETPVLTTWSLAVTQFYQGILIVVWTQRSLQTATSVGQVVLVGAAGYQSDMFSTDCQLWRGTLMSAVRHKSADTMSAMQYTFSTDSLFM